MDDRKGRGTGHTKEIFEEKYGSVESFSRQAVGSLFEDDKPSKQPSDLPPHRRSRSAEDEYEAYLNSASAENHREQARRQAEKEAALARRDSQLDELPKARKQRAEEFTDEDYERAEVSRISHVGRNRPSGNKSPMASLNLRNIAALGLLVFLIILALIVWGWAATNSRLNAVTAELEELEGRYNMLALENADMETHILYLDNQLAAAQQSVAPPITGNDDNDDGEAATGGQTQTQPPAQATGRTHTMQSGDTLSSISRHFFGDTSRVNEIATLNNIADPNNIPVGTVLRIPD